jgi:Fe-S-cluster containining protein
MNKPNWLNDLCIACGACCTNVLSAPVTFEDMKRLTENPRTPVLVQIQPLIHSEQHENYLDCELGCCRALSHVGGTWKCSIYDFRPEICRTYTCHVYQDIVEWYAMAIEQHARSQTRDMIANGELMPWSADQAARDLASSQERKMPGTPNLFRTARSESAVLIQAFEMIPFLRSNMAWEARRDAVSDPDLKPITDRIQEVLGGLQFEESFP